MGDEAWKHYANVHSEHRPKVITVSISDAVQLSPHLTIKPLGEGINLVAFSCGCGANVCHNTAGCPGT